jgi:hypothetical protein
MPTDPPLADRPPVDDLESVFADAPSIEERVYSFLVQDADGVSAPDVAARLSCSADTARKYLEWFAELGVATRREGRPVVYERNAAYFEWRYVSELADAHSLAELRANVLDVRERLGALRDRYDADDPAGVDVVEAAERLGIDVEEAWDDLSAWASLEEELRLQDRARRRLSDRTHASAD